MSMVTSERRTDKDRRNPQFHTLRRLKQAGRFLLTSTWTDKVTGKLINGNIFQAARDAGQATRGMLERGVYLSPSQYYEEVGFTSLVHSVRCGH